MKTIPNSTTIGEAKKYGRFGDTELVHLNKAEVSALKRLTPGGELTVNPKTGQQEAFLPFLLSLLPALIPGIGPAISAGLQGLGVGAGVAGALASPLALSSIGSGLGTAIETGSPLKGLEAGGLSFGLGGGASSGAASAANPAASAASASPSATAGLAGTQPAAAAAAHTVTNPFAGLSDQPLLPSGTPMQAYQVTGMPYSPGQAMENESLSGAGGPQGMPSPIQIAAADQTNLTNPFAASVNQPLSQGASPMATQAAKLSLLQKLGVGVGAMAFDTPSAPKTSTAKFKPHIPVPKTYIAPPAGYRPGIDPEWNYFSPADSVGQIQAAPTSGKLAYKPGTDPFAMLPAWEQAAGYTYASGGNVNRIRKFAIGGPTGGLAYPGGPGSVPGTPGGPPLSGGFIPLQNQGPVMQGGPMGTPQQGAGQAFPGLSPATPPPPSMPTPPQAPGVSQNQYASTAAGLARPPSAPTMQPQQNAVAQGLGQAQQGQPPNPQMQQWRQHFEQSHNGMDPRQWFQSHQDQAAQGGPPHDPYGNVTPFGPQGLYNQANPMPPQTGFGNTFMQQNPLMTGPAPGNPQGGQGGGYMYPGGPGAPVPGTPGGPPLNNNSPVTYAFGGPVRMPQMQQPRMMGGVRPYIPTKAMMNFHPYKPMSFDKPMAAITPRAAGFASGGATSGASSTAPLLALYGGGSNPLSTMAMLQMSQEMNPSNSSPIPPRVAQMGYAAGGPIFGPGDGQSDSVPAMIDNRQPAALSSGEHVIPADVVSHLGNGDNAAGSRRLQAMIHSVRKAKTGTSKMPPLI